MTATPLSNATPHARRAAALFTLAALAAVAGSALHQADLALLATRAAKHPVHAGASARAHANHDVAAPPVPHDDEDDDDGDGPPPEPQLEFIPVVPASEPQSLAT